MRQAYGRLGMSEQEFLDSTWRYVWLRLEGYSEAEYERQKMEWERTRWQAAVALLPYGKKGSNIKPRDLIVFPWEEEARRGKGKAKPARKQKLSAEEEAAMFARLDAAIAKQWQDKT